MASRVLDFPIFDADNHMYETKDALTKFLPKQYAKAVQYVEVEGRTKIVVRGQISEYIPNPTFDVVAAPGAHMAFFSGDNLPIVPITEWPCAFRASKRSRSGSAASSTPWRGSRFAIPLGMNATRPASSRAMAGSPSIFRLTTTTPSKRARSRWSSHRYRPSLEIALVAVHPCRVVTRHT